MGEQEVFFVYVDRKPCGEPFYVGKGNMKRVNFTVRNAAHTNICRKYPDWSREIAFSGDEQDCFAEEVRLIALYGRRDKGTGTLANWTDGGEGASGNMHTGSTRKKMSEVQRKRWAEMSEEEREAHRAACGNHTEEGLRKMSEASKRKWDVWRENGSITSEATRAKISAANKGRKHSEETRAKMSAARRGRKHTPESIAKIRAAKQNISAEIRAKISAANKGRKFSAEARAKMSAAKKGRKLSTEHRTKISAGLLRCYPENGR